MISDTDPTNFQTPSQESDTNYPLLRYLFINVDTSEWDHVLTFIKWGMSTNDGQTILNEIGYTQLTTDDLKTELRKLPN